FLASRRCGACTGRGGRGVRAFFAKAVWMVARVSAVLAGWRFRSRSSILRVLTQGGNDGIPGQAARTRQEDRWRDDGRQLDAERTHESATAGDGRRSSCKRGGNAARRGGAPGRP